MVRNVVLTTKQLEGRLEQRQLTLRRLRDLLRTTPERIAAALRTAEGLRKDAEERLPKEIDAIEREVSYLQKELSRADKREKLLKNIRKASGKLRGLREQAAEISKQTQSGLEEARPC